jgi:hypothetical protein
MANELVTVETEKPVTFADELEAWEVKYDIENDALEELKELLAKYK